jgi:hypothetical protein
VGAGSLWPVNTMKTPGNNCRVPCKFCLDFEPPKLYSFTSGVDVIQKQFDGKKLQEIACL